MVRKAPKPTPPPTAAARLLGLCGMRSSAQTIPWTECISQSTAVQAHPDFWKGCSTSGFSSAFALERKGSRRRGRGGRGTRQGGLVQVVPGLEASIGCVHQGAAKTEGLPPALGQHVTPDCYQTGLLFSGLRVLDMDMSAIRSQTLELQET